jgi:hypothetical protein
MMAPTFCSVHEAELRHRFSGEVEAVGLRSWLGPMLERAHGTSLPDGQRHGGWSPPDMMRVRPSPRAVPPGFVPVLAGLGWAAVVDAALAAMPPRLAAVLRAHYQPEPPGCEGLEPAELRALLLHTAGLSASALKADQARLLRRPVDPVALARVAARRLRAERALFDAREAYARARAATHAPGGA